MGSLPAPTDRMTVTIPGTPITQGSMRAFSRGGRTIVTHDKGPALNYWRSTVTLFARRAWGGRPPIDGPVSLTLTFRLPRPPSHLGTGRNAGTVKASSPALPHAGLDLDKLVRAVGDALTQARIYKDDSRVCQTSTEKVYAAPGEEPGVTIHLEAISVYARCEHGSIQESPAA